jgi:hypothetical protein
VGSFTELQLSFYFRTDVPTAVLATFSPLYQATTPSIQGPAPELPVFVPAPDDDWWEPDWKSLYPGQDHADPYASEPWRHEWAPWLAGSMSVSTVPAAALVWSQLKRWHFSCRSSFKTWPDEIFDAISWLGPFIDAYDNPVNPQPTLVGHMTYDSSARPYLLWCQDGRLSVENLNGPDDEWG